MNGATVEKGQSAEDGAEAADTQPVVGPSGTRKQVYLRSVYPLNPGIPHYVDVPGGWS
jgi:hypothetical protein